MELKYVGDLPIVSKHGVSFDHTAQDKYIYLKSALELLEALSYGATETTKHLYTIEKKVLNSAEILSLLKKYTQNLDEMFKDADTKAHEYVHDLVDRVGSNEHLTIDERTAWLGNIKLMKAYYYQYITNKTAYEAALLALGDEIHTGKILEVSVPMFKNYAMVLNDLIEVLGDRKPPIDGEVKIEEKYEEIIGTLYVKHP